MTVVLIRHAERDASGGDSLSSAGQLRATLLVRMFKDAGISAIFTSEFSRTKQTAAPLAQAVGVTPRALASSLDAALQQLRAAGPLPFVVGHSDTVPQLIAALGGSDAVAIGEHEFDRIFVTSSSADGQTTLAFRYVTA